MQDKKAEAETLVRSDPNNVATEQNKDSELFSIYSQPINKNVTPYKSVTLLDVYKEIVSDKHKRITTKLRSLTSKAERAMCKEMEFDYITVSGTFKKRATKDLIKHSNYFCIDCDHVGGNNAINDLKQQIRSIYEPALMFTSPSGDGLKVVFQIDITEGRHIEYYNAFENFFKSVLNIIIDDKCKDVSRATFLCYDPDCFYIGNPTTLGKEFIDIFSVTVSNQRKEPAPGEPITETREIISRLKVWLNKTQTFVESNRNNYITGLCAAFNRFGIDECIALDELIRYAEEGFPESGIRATVRSIYSDTSKHNISRFEKSNVSTTEAKPCNNLLIVKTVNDWIKEAKLQKIPEKLFGEFWFESEIAILFASSGVGKTLLAYQVSDAITKAKKCLTFNPEYTPKKVVYCDFELSAKQIESRYSANYTNHFDFSENFFRVEINTDADIDPTNFEELIISELERTLNETGAKILIVDNITYFRDEQEKAKDALKLMKQLKALKNRLGLSILILAHTPKRDGTKAITRNDISGSSMIVNFTDSAFTIGESSKDGCYRYLKQVKPGRFCSTKYDAENVIVCSISNPENFTRFEFVEFGSESDHLKTKEGKPRNERDEEIMKMDKSGLSLRVIADKMQLSHTQVSKILNTMKTNGRY